MSGSLPGSVKEDEIKGKHEIYQTEGARIS